MPISITPRSLSTFAIALAACSGALHAGPIAVPNFSFESQIGNASFFGLSFAQDDWQRTDRPAYFTDSAQLAWFQTTANFINPGSGSGRVVNADGAQASYILSFPGAGIFQDYSSVDWAGTTHTLNATFQVGQSYKVTAGIFGENLSDGVQLALDLYYRDGLNNKVAIGTPEVITYHLADFPRPPAGYSLVDFSAEIPAVQATDAWAGQNLGIDIEAISGDGAGQWILDNVRLQSTPVPEPATLGLLAFGLGGLALRRSRR